MLPQGLAVVASLLDPGAPVMQADDPAAPSRSAPDIVLDLPVEIDGTYARDLAVGISADGQTALLRADQFAALLAEHVSAEFLDGLGFPADETFITADEASRQGLSVAYDPAALTLTVGLPSSARRTRSVSLMGGGDRAPPDAIDGPRLSMGLNLFAEPSAAFYGPDTGLQPMAGRAEGFANLGGFAGVNLAWRGSYLEGAAEPVQLNDVVLFHDRFESAVRLAAGTLRPLAPSLYSRTPEVLGLGVFRDYPAIQPFANLRPDGGTGFSLERESRIFVEVNGQVEATRVLGPGAYDLSDLPVRPGGNDVVIYTEDGTRRVELAVLSTFVDTRLLAKGRTLFGFIAGAERLRGGSLPEAGGAVVYTGFVERGVTDQITLGAGFDGRDGETQLTGRVAAGLPIGLLAAEGAWRAGEGGSAGAATLRYSWRSDPRAVRGQTIDVQASVAEPGFGPITTSLRDPFGAPRSARQSELSLRYGLRVNRVALSASARAVRTGARDQLRGTLSAATNVGAYSIALTARAGRTDDPQRGESSDEAILLTLSRRLGRDARVRASYDSEARRTQLQALRFGGQALGDWNANALLSDDEAGQAFDASGGVVLNRAELGVSLRAAEIGDSRTGLARATLGVGLGYADGQVGLGRPFDDGFVIVRAHPSLEDRRLSLSRSGEAWAHNGRLGPALLPLRGAYRTERADIAVENLPVGYDIGAPAIVTFAGARAGYAVTVGSGASNTVMGSLLRPDGTPMALAVGRLVLPGEAEAAEAGAEFFTNRTGRFVAEGLKAGVHEIRMKPDDRVVGTVTIPEEADGLVRAGEVRMTQP